MSDNDIREEVLSILTTIAPEVDPGDIRDDQSLRDQVDLDSMDWLNFLIGIHKRLRVDIPEKDYASLRTLSDVISYVNRTAVQNNSANSTLRTVPTVPVTQDAGQGTAE